MTSRDPRCGWKRLEETLLAIKQGETVTVEALAAECGLSSETVEQVLAAVIAFELFERQEDGCVARRGLFETTTFSESDGRASIVSSRAGQNVRPAKPQAPPEPKS
jgi:predicted DNA-binding transcriptional regulator YafY